MQTQTQTPIFDIAHDYLNALKLRWIGVGATVLATTLAISSVSSDKEWGKALLVSSALGLTVIAKASESAHVTQKRINQDVIDISDASRQQMLYQSMTAGEGPIETPSPVMTLMPPLDSEAATEPLETFELSAVNDQTHLAVIGHSGSGKSVLTQYLLDSFFDGSIVAMDTDASPSEWMGLDKVGQGGDIEAIEQEMSNDIRLLEMRTQRRADGLDLGPDQVRVVEEFPSLMADVSENLERGQGNIAGIWIRKMLRRGRKYGFKVVLVSQELEVKSLGIAGEGSLRKALTILFLGKTAITQLDNVRDKEHRQSLRDYLNAQDRPCLAEVDGQYFPANIPDLSQFLANRKAESFEVKSQELQNLQRPQQYQTMNTGAAMVVEDAEDIAGASTASADPFQEMALKVLAKMANDGRKNGISKSSIIKDIWGRDGANYTKGRDLYDHLLAEGLIKS